jgi:hypothetical protein
LTVSRAWKYTSGFCAVPRTNGCVGVERPAPVSAHQIVVDHRANVSSEISSILFTSCEVRKPSKKWTNGMRVRSVAAWR